MGIGFVELAIVVFFVGAVLAGIVIVTKNKN